jgi:hypothetical protein
MSYSYTQELEHLILDTLLPTYVKHQKSIGVINPYQGLNQQLLAQVKSKKKLPALLRPKENQT